MHCKSVVEDDEWESCWKCSRPRDVGAPGYDEAQHEASELSKVLGQCTRCYRSMEFSGFRYLHHGDDIPVPARSPDFQVEKLAQYHCVRCGKVEWFKADIGSELRSREERG